MPYYKCLLFLLISIVWPNTTNCFPANRSDSCVENRLNNCFPPNNKDGGFLFNLTTILLAKKTPNLCCPSIKARDCYAKLADDCGIVNATVRDDYQRAANDIVLLLTFSDCAVFESGNDCDLFWADTKPGDIVPVN